MLKRLSAKRGMLRHLYVRSATDGWGSAAPRQAANQLRKEKPGETYHPIALATTHLDIQAAPLNADALSRPILITRLLVPQSNPQLPYQAPTIDCADVCRSL